MFSFLFLFLPFINIFSFSFCLYFHNFLLLCLFLFLFFLSFYVLLLLFLFLLFFLFFFIFFFLFFKGSKNLQNSNCAKFIDSVKIISLLKDGWSHNQGSRRSAAKIERCLGTERERVGTLKALAKNVQDYELLESLAQNVLD